MSHSPRGKMNVQDYNVQTKGRLPEVRRFEHATEMARKRGESDIENANNNIRTEYRKRLHDTKEMKCRMEQCVGTLGVEVGILQRCRDEVVEGLRNFEPNVALSNNWAALRKGRSHSPSMYSENVSRAMAQNNDDLKNCIVRLANALEQLEDSLRDLKGHQQYVQREINAKMTSMIIDNACMEELISPSDLMGPEFAELKAKSTLMQSSKLHTSNEWSNTGESVISSAFAKMEVSQARRKKALSVLRATQEAGKYNRNPLVLDAFQARMRYNQQQLASLDLNISMLTGQIDQLDKQRASLTGSLEKLLKQQAIARQRLDVRAMLPSKENTRTGVETTLEVELHTLERNERDLREKLKELEVTNTKQKVLRQGMEHERKDRAAAYATDKACFEMRLPPLTDAMRQKYTLSSETAALSSSPNATVGLAASGRSSGRAYIPAPPQPQHNVETSSGRSLGRAYQTDNQSRRSTASGGYVVDSSPAAPGSASLPAIPAPPSPRSVARHKADVEALLRSDSTGSARSGRGSVRSSRR